MVYIFFFFFSEKEIKLIIMLGPIINGMNNDQLCMNFILDLHIIKSCDIVFRTKLQTVFLRGCSDGRHWFKTPEILLL